MASILVSYRHDCGASALLLYEKLQRRFPGRLMDQDFHVGGNLWPEIEGAISSSCAMLVLIGRTWLDPRLKDPRDWIRREIRCARRKRVRLVPVLVDGAAMPKREALPPDIAGLADFIAIEIRHNRFEDDLHLLVRELDTIIASDETRLRRIDAAAKEAFRTYARHGVRPQHTVIEPVTATHSDHSDSPEKVTSLIQRYYTPELSSRATAGFPICLRRHAYQYHNSGDEKVDRTRNPTMWWTRALHT